MQLWTDFLCSQGWIRWLNQWVCTLSLISNPSVYTHHAGPRHCSINLFSFPFSQRLNLYYITHWLVFVSPAGLLCSCEQKKKSYWVLINKGCLLDCVVYSHPSIHYLYVKGHGEAEANPSWISAKGGVHSRQGGNHLQDTIYIILYHL